MENIEDKEILQSKMIEFLRFPLAIAVVFAHSFGLPSEYVLPDWNAGIDAMDIYNLIRITLSNVSSHITVPVFFFISGFLFFYKVKEFNFSVYKNKIRKRFKTIGVPYLLWNIISILSVVCLLIVVYLAEGKSLTLITKYFETNGWHLFWDSSKWGFDRFDWIGNELIAESGPSNGPLWFLRDLMIVSLLTPVIYFLVKKLKKYVVLVLLCCYVTKIFPQIPGLSISTVFFFTAGAFFSINHRNILTVFGKYQSIILILSVILLLGTVVCDGNNTREGQLIYPFFIIFGSISALNISSYLITKKNWDFPSVLPQSSFFIYASHSILVLMVSNKICKLIFLNSVVMSYLPATMLSLVHYVVTPLFAIVICLSIYCLMRRFAPRLLSILTGNRCHA